ncbi:hypothetical protein ASE23_06630 [Rhizobium sp. Root73]|uniref:hypothetical protein n=1 Tax=unclassified Rhizobium TaxID=2613769 RepID=UPI00072BBA9B|nr:MULTISPECIES: hypothetical protein [unclassified Rhizobium]KQY10812.1 hypothetical protein ASD36_08865 [Rhizobium sp. Root1334]KRC04796.1 hypothetical protein ASE23_06630 [Rhizobium sp. Root73]
MRFVALLLGLSLAAPGHTANVVWRSSDSGVLTSPASAPVILPPEPDVPSGLSATMAGQASVAVGGVLDLRPVAVGASGRIVSYLLFGRLPIGGTFDAGAGKIGGRGLVAGSYPVWVSLGDESGAVTVVAVTIVVRG